MNILQAISLLCLSQALPPGSLFTKAFTLRTTQFHGGLTSGAYNIKQIKMSSKPNEFKPPLSDPVDLDDFELNPEGLIQRAKVVLATDLGLQNGNLLSENFMWIGPYLEQPLGKKDYLAAGRFFDLRSTFPDLDYRGHDYRIDKVDPFTVRLTARTIGTMRGELRLRDKILPPNGKKMSCPPEAISITFDPSSGKISKLCTGFALDRLVGNTKGLCGVMGAATIAGEPPSDFEIYPIPTVVSRFFGRPVAPLGESTTFLAPFPETVMIQLAKGILSSNMAADDASLLAPGFTYWTPTLGPISKKKFLAEYAEEEFKGVEPELNHFRVDQFDVYRVWVDVRPLAPGYEGPPQAMSFTFDDEGFCTRITSSAVMDPSLGNAGGLGGPEGYRYAIGESSPAVATRPLPRVVGRLQKKLISPITGVGVDDYKTGDPNSTGLSRRPPSDNPPSAVETLSTLKQNQATEAQSSSPLSTEAKRPSFSISKPSPKPASKPAPKAPAPAPKRPSLSIPKPPKPAATVGKSGPKRPQASDSKPPAKAVASKTKPQPKRPSLSIPSIPKPAPKSPTSEAKPKPSRPSFSLLGSPTPAPKAGPPKAKPEPKRPSFSIMKPSPKPAAKQTPSRARDAARKQQQESERKQKAAEAKQAEMKKKQEEAARKKREQEQARKSAAEQKRKEVQRQKAQADAEAAKKAEADRKRKEAAEKKQAANKTQKQKSAATVVQKAKPGASISLFGLGGSDDGKSEAEKKTADDTSVKRPTIPLFGGGSSDDKASSQRQAVETAAKAKQGSTIPLFGFGGDDDNKQQRASRAADTVKKASPGSTINLFGLGGGQEKSEPTNKAAPVKKRPSGPVRTAESAQKGATINIFGLGGGAASDTKSTSKASPAAKKAPSKPIPKTASKPLPPKGVPVLSGWKKNGDNSITGSISNSPNFPNGERVTTSPISQGTIAGGNIVKTSSGSRYFLS